MLKQKIKEKNQLIFKLVRALDPFNKNKNKKEILKRLSQLTSSQIQFIQSGIKNDDQEKQKDSNQKNNLNSNKKKVTFILDKSYKPNMKITQKVETMLKKTNKSSLIKQKQQTKANTSQTNANIFSGILKNNKRTLSKQQLKNVHNDLINIQSQVESKFNLSSRESSSHRAETANHYNKSARDRLQLHIRSNSANQNKNSFRKQNISDKYVSEKGRLNSAKLSSYGENKDYLNETYQNRIKISLNESNNYHKQERKTNKNIKNTQNNPQNIPLSQSRLMDSSLLSERNSLPLESILSSKKYFQDNKTNSVSTGQQTQNATSLKNYRSVDNLNKRMIINSSQESELKKLYFNDHLTLKISKDKFKGDSNLQIFKNKLIDKIQENKIQQRYNTLRCRK